MPGRDKIPQTAECRAMIVSPHGLASEAGARVLQSGGNAVDAAVAAAAVLAVTFPHFCGIGGDAVWLLSDASGQVKCLLGIGQATKAANPSTPIPLRGPGSTLTTACAVDSWQAALDFAAGNWGNARNLGELLQPAIELAQRGFPLTRSQRYWLDFRESETCGWPGFENIFTPVGRKPEVGQNFRQPHLAQSIEAIARHGAREFYEGELARRIIAGLSQAGSPISTEDLATTRTRIEDAVSIDYRGLTLHAPPPPTQGLATLATMGLIGQFESAGWQESGTDHFHFVVESIKRAFLLRDTIADPEFADDRMFAMIDDGWIARQARSIRPGLAMAWPSSLRTADTVFLAVRDAAGNCVSMLQSIYFDWGSGVIVGDTGILWQNRGSAFASNPQHPNFIQPGKRPFYTLNPGLATMAGSPRLLYGTQGADGQPQTLAMLLTRLIDFGLSPVDALSGPRFLLGRTFSDQTDSLKVEAHAGETVLGELARRGHEVATLERHSPLAGLAGVIRINANGAIDGAHDPRGEGTALGVG